MALGTSETTSTYVDIVGEAKMDAQTDSSMVEQLMSSRNTVDTVDLDAN